jgi:hypothetical protein
VSLHGAEHPCNLSIWWQTGGCLEHEVCEQRVHALLGMSPGSERVEERSSLELRKEADSCPDIESIYVAQISSSRLIQQRDYSPSAQSGATHEWDVEEDIDKAGLNANDNALDSKGHAASFRDRYNAISYFELLVLQSVGRMTRF